MKYIKLIIFSLLINVNSVGLAQTYTWILWNKSNTVLKVAYASAAWIDNNFSCAPPKNTPNTAVINPGESATLTVDTGNICMGISYPFPTTDNWGISYPTLYYPNVNCSSQELACVTDPCPGQTSCSKS